VKGIWSWPTEEKQQDKTIRNVAASEPLLAVLTAISKSKDGLSNAQVDTAIGDFSQWNTLWALRQLSALGFIEYKTELFGNSGKYTLTELGKTVLQKLTGKPQQPAAVHVPVQKAA